MGIRTNALVDYQVADYSMKLINIQSENGSDSIQIERHEDEHFVNYTVRVVFHGESITKEDVIFTNTAAFVESLKAFEQNRTGVALLEGSEDFELCVEADGSLGHAWVSFQVKRLFFSFSPQTNRGKTGQFLLSGSLPLSGEFIERMTSDFRQLLTKN